MNDTMPASSREPRSSVIIRASIEATGLSIERRVRNLSRSGACIDNDGDLVAGQRVLVSMGLLHHIRAEVMWANPRLAGLRFEGAEVDIESARRPRGSVRVTSTMAAGWLATIDDPYRRHG